MNCAICGVFAYFKHRLRMFYARPEEGELLCDDCYGYADQVILRLRTWKD